MDVLFTEFRRPRPCIFGKKFSDEIFLGCPWGLYLRSVLTFIVDWIFSVVCLLPFISENCIPSGANLVRNYVLLKLFFTVNYILGESESRYFQLITRFGESSHPIFLFPRNNKKTIELNNLLDLNLGHYC